jgi:hypothetical protein
MITERVIMSRARKARLGGFLLAGVCLALALAVTVGGQRPASADQARHAKGTPEVAVADGVPIPPAVRPVIVASGSDFDIGYQYFRQLGQIFGPEVLQEMQNPAGFSDEQLVALRAYQWYLKQYMPELIEEFKGMAAGATDAGVPLSYTEVLASNIASTKAFPGTEPSGSQDDTLPSSGCSGFAAWGSTTKDGKLICAGSQDDEHRYGHLLMVFPETGNDYIVNLSPRWAGDPAHDVAHPGMNNKGLCYVHHGAGVPGNEEEGYASLGAMLWSMHTLRFANTAAQALQMQLSYPSGARVHGLWADTSGDAFNIECRDPQTVRRAGENGEQDFIYATNNCLTKKIKPTQHIWLVEDLGWKLTYVPHGGWTGMDEDAVRRNLDMWNMLHNYHGQVDL